MRKRILSLICCFVLCIALLPISTIAADWIIEDPDPNETVSISVSKESSNSENELADMIPNDGAIGEKNVLNRTLLNEVPKMLTLKEMIEAAADGSTVTLTENVEYNADSEEDTIVIDKDVTIEFNGYKITSSGEYEIFYVSNEGKLTIVDAEIEAIGAIIGYNDGTVIVKSTAGTGINTDDDFLDDNYGTLVIEDGMFRCGWSVFDQSEADGSIVVKSGTYIAGGYCFDDIYGSADFYDVTVESENACIYVCDSGIVNVYGGSYTTKDDCISNSGNVNIYTGHFIATNDSDGCLYGSTYVIPDECIAEPEDWFDTYASEVMVRYRSINVSFYSEGNLYTTQEGNPVDMNFPDEPTNSSGYDFLYWEDAKGDAILSIAELKQDCDLFAVFSDRQYDILFDDKGTLATEKAVVNTRLGSVPGLDRMDNGDGFRCWLLDGEKVDASSTMLVKSELTLVAQYSDIFKVTFDDNGVTYAESVTDGTRIGDVPGIDRMDDGDGFYGWLLDGAKVDKSCDILVDADILLKARYVTEKTRVTNYQELVDALNSKSEFIELAADIPVEDTVVADYDCVITSESGSRFGLIRPDYFTGILLATDKGVIGGEETGGTSFSGTTVTLDNVLVDGRNIMAVAPAVLVENKTTLILRDTTIQNNCNSNQANSYNGDNGGGICNKGTLKMFAGTELKNNEAEKGGGVYNARPGNDWIYGEQVYDDPITFYMYGGVISGNIARDDYTSCNSAGGGVNVDGDYSSQAKFYMYGGSITENSAPSGCGGGISLCCGDQSAIETESDERNIVFSMFGGEITNNTTGASGGGVWIGCSSMYMENGLIAGNIAAEDGGAISACCGCEENIDMRGGTITLNLAQRGGGVGDYVGGYLLSDSIYDNLTTGEDKTKYGWLYRSYGDDILYYWGDEWIDIAASKAYRAYGSSYEGASLMPSDIQDAVASALPTVNAELIEGYDAPTGVMVPFCGWYVDGAKEDEAISRYDSPSGSMHSSGSIHWNRSTPDYLGTDYEKGTKAIWNGLLLLYDANYEGGEYRYDNLAYQTGSIADVAANTFLRNGYTFTGWNTKPDGSGNTYHPNSIIKISESQVLYAQWEKDLYKLSYEVNDDPSFGSPADAVLPSEITDIEYGTIQTLGTIMTTEWNTSTGKDDDGIPGKWNFTGWSTDDACTDTITELVILKNGTVYGKWQFTPLSKVGNLTISKTVSGDNADKSKAFDFNVVLNDTFVNGIYGDLSFTNGVAIFSLKDGESKTAAGLPAGTNYTVSEADYSTEGYVTTKNGNTGVIIEDETVTAKFTNTKDSSSPKTGDDSHFQRWMLLMAVSAVALTGTGFYSRKCRKNIK